MSFGLYSASGFLVGFLVGLTGVGGGSLMTPLLVLAFGVHPQTAVGTDLLFAAATKSVGTLVHNSKRSVRWRIVGALAAGSIPATAVAVLALDRLGPASAGTGKLISLSLGLALFATGASILFKPRLMKWAARSRPRSALQRTSLTILVGAVLGVLVTFSSVGAGAIGVTALIFLYPELTAAEIVGSDVAHAVPLTLAAGLGHLYLGSINWLMLGSLLVGSVPGIVLGSLSATRVPELYLRPILAAVLAIVGYRLIFA